MLDVNKITIEPVNFYIKERRLHIDIENESESGNRVANASIANKQIYSISCLDSYKLKRPRRVVTSFLQRSDLNKETLFKVLTTPINTSYDWYILTFDNEDEMLRRFSDYYKYINCDFFCGWNAQNYDIPYLINRFDKKRIDYKFFSPIDKVWYNSDMKKYQIDGTVVFDSMLAYKKMNAGKTVSLKLEDAGQDTLGYGKIKHKENLDTLYKTDINKFIYYNAIDVVLDYEITQFVNSHDFFSGIFKFIGCPYNNIYWNSMIIDYMFLAEAVERNFVLPEKDTEHENEKEESDDNDSYEGGYVEVPKVVGRNQNILYLDLRSMYPCIMISWNMGNESIIYSNLNDNIRLPQEFNYGFSKKKSSFVAECLKKLITYRDEIKKEILELEERQKKGENLKKKIKQLNNEQTIVKFITNTIYGVMGRPNFRLYNRDIAQAVTGVGRMIIKDSAKKCRELGFETIYGDTDSIMIQLNTNDKEKWIQYIREHHEGKINDFNAFSDDELCMIGQSYYLSDKLNEMYKIYTKRFNLIENLLEIKPEDISSQFFMSKKKGEERTSKKRYIKRLLIEFVMGKPFRKDKVITKGYITIAMSAVCKKLFKRISEYITAIDKDNESVNKEIVSLYNEAVGKINNLEFPLEDICMKKGIKRPLKSYKSLPQIRAVRFTNENAFKWNGSANYGEGSLAYYVPVDCKRIPRMYVRSNTDYVALDENRELPQQLTDAIDLDELIGKTITDPLEEIFVSLGIKRPSKTKNVIEESNKNKMF